MAATGSPPSAANPAPGEQECRSVAPVSPRRVAQSVDLAALAGSIPADARSAALDAPAVALAARSDAPAHPALAAAAQSATRSLEAILDRVDQANRSADSECRQALQLHIPDRSGVQGEQAGVLVAQIPVNFDPAHPAFLQPD